MAAKPSEDSTEAPDISIDLTEESQNVQIRLEFVLVSR